MLRSTGSGTSDQADKALQQARVSLPEIQITLPGASPPPRARSLDIDERRARRASVSPFFDMGPSATPTPSGSSSDLMREIILAKSSHLDVSSFSDKRRSVGGSSVSSTPSSTTRMKTLEVILARCQKLSIDDIDDEEEDIEQAGGLLAKHASAIALASSVGNFFVSFRPAGKHTLARLADGAATKDHSILEKTIKESSLKGAYPGKQATELLAKLEAAKLSGLVGVWGAGGIKGLYLTEEGADVMRQTGFEPAANGKGQPYLELDVKAGTAADLEAEVRAKLGGEDKFHQFLITGDYDTHDIISFSQRPHPVSSGSPEEDFVRNAINTAVSGVDPERPFDKKSHNVVQHGPQYNYVAHMRTNEPGADIVPQVAAPSVSKEEPLFVVNRGNWITVNTEKKLTQLYKKMGIEIKAGWRSGS